MNYASLVGEKLRNIRLQKGMSLHQAEAASESEFKASVLGAYERGERSISVPRLQRLATFYQVPVDQLLPKDPGDADTAKQPNQPPDKITIDLQRLETVAGPEKGVIQRYLNLVQMQRGDFNGKVLTIRGGDLMAIASVLDLSVDTLTAKLDDLGVRATVVH